jgi:hypothetical protein
MTQQTLSRVTLQNIENVRTAATQTVAASRIGGRRMVGAINVALKDGVYPQTARLAPNATDRMDQIRGNISDAVVKGIDQIAKGADKFIQFGSAGVARQVTKVARFTSDIDNEIVANGLQAAARLAMPGAQVALLVSGKVSQGTAALARAAGARPARKAVAGSSRKPVSTARRSGATTTAASKGGTKARRAARKGK